MVRRFECCKCDLVNIFLVVFIRYRENLLMIVEKFSLFVVKVNFYCRKLKLVVLFIFGD